jgi:hypothetical protein
MSRIRERTKQKDTDGDAKQKLTQTGSITSVNHDYAIPDCAVLGAHDGSVISWRKHLIVALSRSLLATTSVGAKAW